MSKHWKPKRETVALPSSGPRPSRIRRDPARIDAKRLDDKVKPRSREREIWEAVAGVALIAAGCAALVVGVSAVTSSDSSAAATPGTKFTHCSSQFGPNCVVDGDTFQIAGEKVEIAGIDAPEIRGAGCTEEARRGIQAALRLHDMLNTGELAILGTERASDGHVGSKVEVDGRDVGVALIAADLARSYGDGPRSWCA